MANPFSGPQSSLSPCQAHSGCGCGPRAGPHSSVCLASGWLGLLGLFGSPCIAEVLGIVSWLVKPDEVPVGVRSSIAAPELCPSLHLCVCMQCVLPSCFFQKTPTAGPARGAQSQSVRLEQHGSPLAEVQPRPEAHAEEDPHPGIYLMPRPVLATLFHVQRSSSECKTAWREVQSPSGVHRPPGTGLESGPAPVPLSGSYCLCS